MIRRALFLAVGGFDKGLFMGLEDVDLGWRPRAVGYRNFYVPQAVVRHIGSHSVKRSGCTTAVSRHLLALLAKNARKRIYRLASAVAVSLFVLSLIRRLKVEYLLA